MSDGVTRVETFVLTIPPEKPCLGATDPVDFEPLISEMAEITGYPIATVDLPGSGVFYATSNQRVRDRMGYQPQWTIHRMLSDAAEARKARAAR